MIYSVDPIARRYKWLPLVSSTVQTIPFDERFDCTIVVDCADVTLLGDSLPPPEVCGHADHARSPCERSPVR